MPTRVNKAHTCGKCGHTWTQMARLMGRLPRVCPRCKNYDWNKPATKEATP